MFFRRSNPTIVEGQATPVNTESTTSGTVKIKSPSDAKESPKTPSEQKTASQSPPDGKASRKPQKPGASPTDTKTSPNRKSAETNKSTSPVPSPPKLPLPAIPKDSQSSSSKAESRYDVTAGDRIFRRSGIFPRCFRCTKAIKDIEFICSTEQCFHIDCFKCALCSKKLIPGQHILYDRFLYCKVDCIPLAEKEEAPAESGENLATPLELFVHRPRRNGQLCFKCGLSTNGTSWVISLNRVFHRVCFKCTLCKRELTPSDHVLKDVDSYCKYPCYERKFVRPKPVSKA